MIIANIEKIRPLLALVVKNRLELFLPNAEKTINSGAIHDAINPKKGMNETIKQISPPILPTLQKTSQTLGLFLGSIVFLSSVLSQPH